ncbi:MAG: hypothetical protein ABIC04_04860 [Nanoarchaeota archaeon]
MSQIPEFIINFDKKQVHVYMIFDSEKFGPRKFAYRVQAYLRRAGINKKVELGYVHYKQEVKKVLKKLVNQAIEKVPYVLEITPLTIYLRIHDAYWKEEGELVGKTDTYHSMYEDADSRIDKHLGINKMVIDLNGKSLTDLYVAPRYFSNRFEKRKAAIELKTVLDLESHFHYHCMLHDYRQITILKNRLENRDKLSDKQINAMLNCRIMPFYELLSDIKREGITEFVITRNKNLYFEAYRIIRLRKFIQRLIKRMEDDNIPIEKLSKYYIDHSYNLEDSDIPIVGKYMCFFIGLAIAKQSGVKTITVNNRLMDIDDIKKLDTDSIIFNPLPPKISTITYRMIYGIKSKNHYKRFNHLYVSSCKDLGLPKKYWLFSASEISEDKKQIIAINQKRYNYWLRKAGFTNVEHTFSEILEKHFELRLL